MSITTVDTKYVCECVYCVSGQHFVNCEFYSGIVCVCVCMCVREIVCCVCGICMLGMCVLN